MTKKYLLAIVVLFGFLVLPFASIAETATLQRGMTSDSVKDLQNVLKSDSSIYPQGLAIGFYGPATEAAIKKLQARYGLSQTGVVDSATWQVIFPTNVQLKVISPNGGESWDKSSNHSVTWQVTVGPVVVNGQELAPASSNVSGLQAKPSLAPFYDNVSIDLIKDSNPNYRYHIATTNLYQTQFNWKMPDSISNASDYRVQISVGGAVPCFAGMDTSQVGRGLEYCPLYYPQYSATDQSDNVFSITGAGGISNDAKAKLTAMINQLQQQINSLQSQLNAMRDLVTGL